MEFVYYHFCSPERRFTLNLSFGYQLYLVAFLLNSYTPLLVAWDSTLPTLTTF